MILEAMESYQKIIITGPESSGKTTLAAGLAAHFSSFWVEEYARRYLENLGRPYREEDLLEIAKGQYLWEGYLANFASPYLICDTSMLVIKVWSEYRFGRSSSWIREQVAYSRKALYLLCAPDIPWTPDPLRENPHDREELLRIYRQELEHLGAPYLLVQGTDQAARLEIAVEFIGRSGIAG